MWRVVQCVCADRQRWLYLGCQPGAAIVETLSWYAASCTRAHLVTTHLRHIALGPTSVWLEWGLNPLNPQRTSLRDVKTLFSSLLILRGVMRCEIDLPLASTPSCPGLPYSAAVVQVWAAPTGRRQVPRGVLLEIAKTAATVTRRVNCAHNLTMAENRRDLQPFLHRPADPPPTTNSDYLGRPPPCAPPRGTGHRAQVHWHLGTLELWRFARARRLGLLHAPLLCSSLHMCALPSSHFL